MNMKTNTTLQNLEFDVNDIFECQEKVLELESQRKYFDAEMVLMQHLARAFQLLDGGQKHV